MNLSNAYAQFLNIMYDKKLEIFGTMELHTQGLKEEPDKN